MINPLISLALVVAGLVLAGCEAPERRSDRPASGAIDHSTDATQRERLREPSPETSQRVERAQPLGVTDVTALAKAGMSNEVIIDQIRNSQTVYHLNTAEIVDLKDSGVSEKVIDYMINTSSLDSLSPPPASAVPYEEAAVVATPPPPPVVEEVMVSPGPEYVWVAGSWGWYGRHWVWGRGRWARPPHRRALWVPSRWERRGAGGVWISGHWR